MQQVFTGWGLYPGIKANYVVPDNEAALRTIVASATQITPRGNGRSYGDAALGEYLVLSQHLNKILAFDNSAGIIEVESGVLLDDILKVIVPQGFFLPVSPGTKFISVGGALAADIHGKNHHIEGVFSDHVISFRLLEAAGNILEIVPGDDLFAQTAGGMGLTGFILSIRFKLKPIETAYISQHAIRAKNLREIFDLFEKNKDAPYSVAWIDCFAEGDQLGRSVLLLGKHTKVAELSGKEPLKTHQSAALSIPFFFPSWILNSLTIKIFNWLYYQKPSSQGHSIVHYDPYFYPLDKLHHWNKIYGRKGFIQYQFVLPEAVSYDGIKRILTLFAKYKMGSFLAVLKLFGESHEGRYLHFPMKGYTLALDIKVSDSLWQVLEEADKMVNELGGKIYLAKDARMSKASFEKQYTQTLSPNNKFTSAQMNRLRSGIQKVYLILGANSDIAKETVLAWRVKEPQAYFLLASRNTIVVEKFVSEQQLSEQALVLFFDASAMHTHKDFVVNLPYKPQVILYAAGLLEENEQLMKNLDTWKAVAEANFIGAVSVLNQLVDADNPNLEKIIGISSIAGLRVRKANFMYGSLKAGFHGYLFGLRQYLRERGVIVQAITPGFVQTKMTAHLGEMKKANTPAEVARVIVADTNRFEIFPNRFWFLVGNMIKWLPEKIVSRL
ncbi:MAG: SDR family NAD(P)-dependent oxidoreductase [Sediminibacterium sp.]|nr:SDR family NAD(P)-dependent oxidoreductase [Sediminibacterium sp.]